MCIRDRLTDGPPCRPIATMAAAQPPPRPQPDRRRARSPSTGAVCACLCAHSAPCCMCVCAHNPSYLRVCLCARAAAHHESTLKSQNNLA
eukprot:3818389-Prymnesium_polylepis.1